MLLEGGRIGLSLLKKLDLLLRMAGDSGNCASVSSVLSESDGRDFFGRTVGVDLNTFSTS